MNLKVVGYYSHLILAFMALLILGPLSLALVEGARDSVFSFGVTFTVMLTVALALRRFGDSEAAVRRYDAFGIVAFIWLIIGVLGGLPLYLEGAVSSYTSAMFESVSGFTTTGATVVANVEELSRPVNLWRHLSHWVGGMGIVVLFVAVFPFLGVGAKHLFRSEATGPINDSLRPRIRHTALRLWWIYATLTTVCFGMYMFFGMDWFEALCHAFSTLSTGGFSTRGASLGGFESSALEWTAIAFMLIGGFNFGLYYAVVHGNLKALYTNYEARFFLVLNIGVALLIAGFLWKEGQGIEAGLRSALFQTAAVTTTTGLMTDDFDRYPDAIRLLLFFCMFIGGCAGSTAGGIKVSRLYIIFKSVLNEIAHVVRPQAVFSVRVGDRAVAKDVIQNIYGFVAIYFIIFALGSLALGAMGLDFESATSSVVASLSSVGPGFGAVGPTMNYEFIPALGKIILCFCMIAGRLEIFVLMALFSPMTWRK